MSIEEDIRVSHLHITERQPTNFFFIAFYNEEVKGKEKSFFIDFFFF